MKHNILDGEYIVQLNPTADGNLIFNKEVKSRSNSQISVTHIMSQPLNLWLLKNVEDGHQEIISSLRSNQQVKSISQNKTISYRTNPNDSLYSKQWQYNNIGANGGVAGADMDMDLAWDIAKGGLTPSGDTIVICVIDDGINNQHEDIKGNLWYNHHEIPNNDIDDDNNGYVDDFQGWNVGTDDDDVYSGGGHGTPVSGIIGAVGNNKIGVSGVNWKVKIMMVNYNSPTEANALSAYGYAYKYEKNSTMRLMEKRSIHSSY
ncbi:MAG: S8 family serine peptidase [Saprospiraceae bacterium]